MATQELIAFRSQQGQQTAEVGVPERPALAPNIELVGALQESGFQDQQWLIERNGQFIQVTELLYRIAEQANGERTLEEIAAGVTAATEWIVTADHVRQLIERKLIPLRIITTADGSVMLSNSTMDERQGGSALAFSVRMKMLDPHIINPITKVTQFLFAPPILIPLLIVIAAVHGWLYFLHGVVDSILEVLYTPGLLLVVILITVVAGIFHEFGHASALQYGGGKVRAMGVGLYIIYPALYTDTTDSYRLGRWARVRTDLGGFYFHLLFTLGIIGIYLLSGLEFLLVVVLLINLDILYQLLPFVRLDGYWTLADLTGIPDFFSQMGPFLASMVPVRGYQGSKLPALKPWVKIVFTLYIVLTIPVLALLFFLMIRRLPRFMPVIWDSFLAQAGSLSHALDQGDLIGMIGSFLQMIILLLPVLGAAFVLYRVSRTLIKALWNWSKPTPARRVAGAFATIGVLALVVFLWMPNLPMIGQFMPSEPDGTESFEIIERSHVETPISYPQNPPVGGNHAWIWLNCGFYDMPVPNENAVHSLEHGAVWITYRPDLPEDQIDSLRQMAQRQTYILVSPLPDLSTPVVASAWGWQLRLDSVDDPRLKEFVRTFRLGQQAPERGGGCTGGVGEPK